MNSSPAKTFPWLAFFRLLRLPNVFTAWADVLMGFLVAQGAFPTSPSGIASIFLLLAATTGLYLGGMVLNDWFDYVEDSKARPFRPLPSKTFSLRFAATFGFGLLFFGVIFAAAASFVWRHFVVTENAASPFVPLMAALLLAAAVLAYNGLLKPTPIGPIAMGACRTLNILLGISIAPLAGSASSALFSTSQLAIAAGIGIYIAGVTWFARKEEVQSPRAGLILGFLVMAAGVALLAFAPDFGGLPQSRVTGANYRWLMLLVGGVPAIRCVRAIADPSPVKVQTAIKISILSLIWLDAAIALRVASFQEALLIAFLIAPALLIGRAVYST